VKQSERSFTSDPSTQNVKQRFVIDRIEVFPDISLQYERRARAVSRALPDEGIEPVIRGKCPFPGPIRIRIEDESAIEHGTDHSAHSVVEHPVTDRRLGYFPPLWIVDDESGILSVTILPGFQVESERHEMFFDPITELDDVFFGTFPDSEFTPRDNQVLK
jgi:hypothetical protein